MKLSKIYYILALIIYLLVFISACTEEVQDPFDKPEKLTMKILSDTIHWGYTWFLPNYNAYVPDSNIVKQIAETFNQNPCKFYIYVNPSCHCTGTQKEFPSIVKTLTSAKISESYFEMYSSDGKNPYENIVKVERFPSCFIIRGNKAIYSVMDTLAQYNDKNYLVEEVILMGLKQ